MEHRRISLYIVTASFTVHMKINYGIFNEMFYSTLYAEA